MKFLNFTKILCETSLRFIFGAEVYLQIISFLSSFEYVRIQLFQNIRLFMSETLGDFYAIMRIIILRKYNCYECWIGINDFVTEICSTP